jgi:hypothetical protein
MIQRYQLGHARPDRHPGAHLGVSKLSVANNAGLSGVFYIHSCILLANARGTNNNDTPALRMFRPTRNPSTELAMFGNCSKTIIPKVNRHTPLTSLPCRVAHWRLIPRHTKIDCDG